MELFKLVNSTWLPGARVKDFESLIWTERYQTAGDFQLIVKDDVSILTALPLDTLISHTDTKEVMIVENHEIDRDSKKKLIVTVTGRSLETFTENRLTTGSSTALESAGVANVETVTGTSENIAANLITTAFTPVPDQIPNISVSVVARVPDASYSQVLKRGDIYTRLLEFLQLGNYGIKITRPLVAGNPMAFIIHDGLDLSATVIFKAQNEDLDNAKYLWTKKDSKNYATVAAKNFVHEYRQRDLLSDVTGLNRRSLYVEAQDLDGAYAFGSTDGVVSSRAQNELSFHPLITLMQGVVAKTAKSKFKIDYDIGDLVTVSGEFGLVQPMRVVEHILTKDKNGIQGYPSLAIA